MNAILEVATRWKTTFNTEHLLKLASCYAEKRREKNKKTVHVSWETVYDLSSVNRHGTENINKMFRIYVLELDVVNVLC